MRLHITCQTPAVPVGCYASDVCYVCPHIDACATPCRDPDTPLVVKAFDANNSDEEPALRQAIAQADTPLAPLCDGGRRR
jgi:hypothetical protein